MKKLYQHHFKRAVPNTHDKIQDCLDGLIYNPTDHASSPRWVMITGEGHKPLKVDLIAENDDHHVIAVYKDKTGWGSLSKSNTTLLRGRHPYYLNVRELVMSYFDFYFNTKGQLSLYGYSNPINLNRYNSWQWRISDNDLMKMGMAFSDETHYEIVSPAKIKKMRKVSQSLKDACFLGADQNGLFKAN